MHWSKQYCNSEKILPDVLHEHGPTRGDTSSHEPWLHWSKSRANLELKARRVNSACRLDRGKRERAPFLRMGGKVSGLIGGASRKIPGRRNCKIQIRAKSLSRVLKPGQGGFSGFCRSGNQASAGEGSAEYLPGFLPFSKKPLFFPRRASSNPQGSSRRLAAPSRLPHLLSSGSNQGPTPPARRLRALPPPPPPPPPLAFTAPAATAAALDAAWPTRGADPASLASSLLVSRGKEGSSLIWRWAGFYGYPPILPPPPPLAKTTTRRRLQPPLFPLNPSAGWSLQES